MVFIAPRIHHALAEFFQFIDFAAPAVARDNLERGLEHSGPFIRAVFSYWMKIVWDCLGDIDDAPSPADLTQCFAAGTGDPALGCRLAEGRSWHVIRSSRACCFNLRRGKEGYFAEYVAMLAGMSDAFKGY